jgi:hypothetical protein
MRTLSQKDLEEFKSKNIKVIGRRGKKIKPKADNTEKLLAKIYNRVFSSAEDILLQLGGIKNTLKKISERIKVETVRPANSQNADFEIQTQKIILKLDEKKDVKKWRFNVVRNNRGFITDVIATAEEDSK